MGSCRLRPSRRSKDTKQKCFLCMCVAVTFTHRCACARTGNASSRYEKTQGFFYDCSVMLMSAVAYKKNGGNLMLGWNCSARKCREVLHLARRHSPRVAFAGRTKDIGQLLYGM